MRIETLLLKRYGHFTDFSLDFGARDPDGSGETKTTDFHILYGPNEAGKSTTLAAILDFLYGFKRQTPWGFLHPYELLEIEGTLRQGGRRCTIRRFKTYLANESGERIETFPLDLQGLTREEYARRFSFDELTIEEGGEQILNSEGDVGQALFSASAGLSDLKFQLDDAMRDANTFWEPGKTKHIRLKEYKDRLLAISRDQSEVKLDQKTWESRRDALEQACISRDSARDYKNQVEAQYETVLEKQRARSIAQRLGIQLEQRNVLESKGVAPATVIGIPSLSQVDDVIYQQEVVKQLVDDIQLNLARQLDLEQQVSSLTQRLEGLQNTPASRLLLDSAREVVSLYGEISAEHEWRMQLSDVDTLIKQTDVSSKAKCTVLNIPYSDRLNTLLPGDTVLGHIDQLLGEEISLSTSLKFAQSELERLDYSPVATHVDNPSLANEEVDTSVLADVIKRMQQDALPQRLESEKQAQLDCEQLLIKQVSDSGMNPNQVKTLALPEQAKLDQAITDLSEAQTSLDSNKKIIEQHTRSIEAIDLSISRLYDTNTPYPDQLTSSRQARDDAWLLHRNSLDSDGSLSELRKSATRFEQLMQKHDVHQENVLLNTGKITEIELLNRQKNELELALKEQQSGFRLALDEYEKNSHRLKTLTAGFYTWNTFSADVIRHQYVQALRIQETSTRLQKHEFTVSRLIRKCEDEAKLLRDLLTPLETPGRIKSIATLELKDLLEQASKTLLNIQDRQRALQELARTVDEFRQQHKERTNALLKLTTKKQQWVAQWNQTVESTLFERLNPDQARDVLPSVRELKDSLKIREQASSKQDALTARLQTRNSAVASLLKRLKLDSLTDANSRLKQAKENQKEFERLSEELTQLKQRVVTLEAQIADKNTSLGSFRTALSVTSDEDLISLLERTKQHRTINESFNDALSQLEEITGRRVTDAELTELLELDQESLSAGIRSLQSKRAEASAAYDESSQQWALANRELSDTTGSSEYARLSEERANLLLQIKEEATETARARLGLIVVKAAISRFRQIHQSALLSEAQAAFTTLTGGRYTSLVPQDDGRGNERLYAIDETQVARGVDDLSTGTRYQLYLALRAAAHTEYSHQRTPLPFVADDIMETFDDERAAAAFKVFANMARHGQVLYLTHHQHLVDIARDVLGPEAVQVHHYPNIK